MTSQPSNHCLIALISVAFSGHSIYVDVHRKAILYRHCECPLGCCAQIKEAHAQRLISAMLCKDPESAVQDGFARIMSAYEDRTLSVWLEVAEQFGMSREAAAQLSS